MTNWLILELYFRSDTHGHKRTFINLVTLLVILCWYKSVYRKFVVDSIGAASEDEQYSTAGCFRESSLNIIL